MRAARRAGRYTATPQMVETIVAIASSTSPEEGVASPTICERSPRSKAVASGILASRPVTTEAERSRKKRGVVTTRKALRCGGFYSNGAEKPLQGRAVSALDRARKE